MLTKFASFHPGSEIGPPDHFLISLGIFTTSFTGGKKISRVNPSDTGGKTGGKNIPRLRLRNSVGNLSFKSDGDMSRETKEKKSDMLENSF